ncbi:non-specific lipid-transfer protein [Genlisea aurea]|uniref:Non-specific lipid-transfer protein n=1 Tax=Genlisea aurea TaxID=192259 RepID=S8ECT1_9LAMI|nr:non-specific lipid-transfer protein [Genlisea aurea]
MGLLSHFKNPMPTSSSSFIVLLFAAAILAATVPADGSLTCTQLLTIVSPCVRYVQTGGALPYSCCDALRALNSASHTTPDLQIACGCLKELVPALRVNPDLINGLPGKCNIPFPYRYSSSLDCSKVHV